MIKKPTYAGIGKIWISLLLLSIAIVAGIPNTVLALLGIGLTLYIAKDKLNLEEKIENIRGRINL